MTATIQDRRTTKSQEKVTGTKAHLQGHELLWGDTDPPKFVHHLSGRKHVETGG